MSETTLNTNWDDVRFRLEVGNPILASNNHTRSAPQTRTKRETFTHISTKFDEERHALYALILTFC